MTAGYEGVEMKMRPTDLMDHEDLAELDGEWTPMDPVNAERSLSQAGSNNQVDPLLEQMSSVLRLHDRPAVAQPKSPRTRRFSDAGRPTSNGTPPQSEPITVRSRDGSRWLPAPDTPTHRYGGPSSECAVERGVELNMSVSTEQHACQAAVCAVAKVFGTTELLELILGFLHTRDVLNLRGTSAMWDGTVKASPELRLHFFYYPQFLKPASAFQLLPLSMPGTSVELGEPLHMGQWISASFTSEAARRISPAQSHKRVRSRSIFEGLRGGLGSRAGEASDSWPQPKLTKPAESVLQYSDLFLTQPPVVNMQAYIIRSSAIKPASQTSTATRPDSGEDDDDIDDSDVPAACAKLHCDSGITLGFLADTALSLLSGTKPTVRSGDRGASGVMFKTIISFCGSEAVIRKRSNTRDVTKIG